MCRVLGKDFVLGRGKCKNYKVGVNIECLRSSRKIKVVVMECTERRKEKKRLDIGRFSLYKVLLGRSLDLFCVRW